MLRRFTLCAFAALLCSSLPLYGINVSTNTINIGPGGGNTHVTWTGAPGYFVAGLSSSSTGVYIQNGTSTPTAGSVDIYVDPNYGLTAITGYANLYFGGSSYRISVNQAPNFHVSLSTTEIDPPFNSGTYTLTATGNISGQAYSITPQIFDPPFVTFTSPTTGLTGAQTITFTVTANTMGFGREEDFIIGDSYLYVYQAAGPSVSVPGPPTNVTASPRSGSAVVTFSIPASNGGAAISSYVVTSSPGGLTGSGSGSPLTVTGLTNGTAYTFTVAAINSVGTSPASAPSGAVTPATIPGAPQSVSATGGNGQATVSFSAPASNGGATITRYTVTANPGGFTGTGSGSPITVTELTNGTAYTFTVTATNSTGAGTASTASNSVTPMTVPGAPQIGVVTGGNGQASISFSAPASNGGAAITGYTVTSSPGGITATGNSSPLTVTGLVNGTAYTFTITATNGSGTGAASTASSSVIPATIPGAPQSVSATGGNGQATVSFTAPASNGGATITRYTVTANPGGFTGTGSGSPITVTELTNGTAYTFTVTATNSTGAGTASAASNSVIPVTVPGAPQIGVVTGGNGQASISFLAPVNNGGSAITGYSVTSSPGGFAGTGTASPIIVTGLSNGTAYTFTVTATNSGGMGLASTPSSPVTPATVASAPQNVSATGGNALAVISFAAPSSNGGAAITGYTVTSSPGGLTGTGSASPITVSGLLNGTAYTFTATATNGAGTGPVSVASNTVTPATVPGSPQGVTALAGNAQAVVSFVAPGSNGGAAITSYTVTSSPGGFTATGTTSPITVTGLANGTTYTFSVTAANSVGAGSASLLSSGVTPATVPGAPQSVSATGGNGQALVSFLAPSNNGGAVITSYLVTSSPGGFTASGSASPVSITGLANGTAYTFTVTATNSAGAGAASGMSNPVTPITMPGAPQIGNVTGGNGLAAISFTPPGDGGSAITGYTVTSSPGGLSATGVASPITVNGLSNGTAYTFTMTATNSAGTGVASAPSASVTPATVPGAPVSILATRVNGQAVISFAAPASNGGAAITAYTVTSSPGGLTAMGSGSPITVTGLANGTPYTFTVTATNTAGTGAASAPSDPITTITSPGAPQGVSVSAGNAQAVVSFIAPASNGGSAITSYTVTSSPGGFTATGTGSPITITGLTNGTAYTFTVTAANSAGAGAASPASASTTPATVPGVPQINSTAAGRGQATIFFSAPLTNGGSPITSYTVISNPGNLTVIGSSSPITVTGLTNGTAYNFSVYASNDTGSGAPAITTDSVTPSDSPGVPRNVSASGGNGQAVVSFLEPVSNGGGSITSYTVTSSPGGFTATGASSPITVTGLSNGVAYTFSVTATNAAGPGSASTASNPVTPATVPGAPQSVSASGGDSATTISFAPPANTGGASILSYTVTSLPGGITATGAASPIVISGLANGTSYTFSVSATNAAGTGPASASSNSVKPAGNPVKLLSLASLPVGFVGADYPLQILTTSGGVAPYHYSVTGGSIPPGLSFTDPQLSGIPTAAGTFPFTITVTDSEGNTASAAVSLAINPASADLILSQSTQVFSLTAGATGTPSPASITVRSSDVQQLLHYSVSVTPATSWLDVTGGVTTPSVIALSVNSAALNVPASSQPYNATVKVSCNAPSPCAGNIYSINVVLSVSAPPPQIATGANVLAYQAAANGEIAPQSLEIRNSGGGSLIINSVSALDSWISIAGIPASISAGTPATLSVTASAAGLGAGYYRSAILIDSSAGQVTVPATLLIPANATMILGPTGTQFQTAAGSPPGSVNGSFSLTSAGSSSIAWSGSVVSGGAWLKLNGSSGSTSPAGSTVGFSLDPAAVSALAPGTYYAGIRIDSPDVSNSPQDYEVVLSVKPAARPVQPILAPTGLIFSTSTAATDSTQKVSVQASSRTPLTYQASASTSDGASWLTVTPSTDTTSSATPGQSGVSVNAAGLTPGVYTGSVSYALSAAAVRTVSVTLVVAGSPTRTAASESAAGVPAGVPGCKPSRIILVEVALPGNFQQQAGWPAPLTALAVNDCGERVTGGQVSATFSNGDSPVILSPTDTRSGIYVGTWIPRTVSPQVVVTTSINAPASPIPGQTWSTRTAGEVIWNSVPMLAEGGAVNVFNPLIGAAVAPGTVISIYGSNLSADSGQAASVPLPASLAGASVRIGGIPAPLYYASPGQLNAQVPFELTAGNRYQIQVSSGDDSSSFGTLQIAPVSPAIAVLPSGEVLVQHALSGALVSAAFPAIPGEYLTLYAVGLGAAGSFVATGAGSPSDPLARPVITPVLTLNDVVTPVDFAGLTPGAVGLYQVNFRLPDTASGTVQVALKQGSVKSNTGTLLVK